MSVINCPHCGYSPEIEIASFVEGEYFAKVKCDWCWITARSRVFSTECEAIADAVNKWNKEVSSN